MICDGNQQKRRRNPIAQINKALNQVGPIPGGKEVVVQYTSDIISDGKFYTGALILVGFPYTLPIYWLSSQAGTLASLYPIFNPMYKIIN